MDFLRHWLQETRMRHRYIAWIAPALLSLASPAFAHAILLDSQPAFGASLHSGHVELRLRYNSRIDAARSRLVLTGPDHAPHVLPFAAGPTPDLLLAAAELAPGAYVLRWQVLAVDGHITRGDMAFTLTAVGPAP